MPTIRDMLQTAYTHLAQSATPHLDARMIVCHVLGVEPPYLVAQDERPLTADEAAHIAALIERRATGEPMAYITGEKGFYDLVLRVTPAVLVPRPETEHLVEAALAFAKTRQTVIAADIGTGSGAIAVTLAKHAPQATVHALDVSAAALRVARENAAQHAPQVIFHQGHLAQPLIDAGIKVDLLLANLPYIRHDDMPTLAVSQHEPHLALDGGPDGVDLIRALLRQVPAVCAHQAAILLEIGAEQGDAVRDFARQTLAPAHIAVHQDYAGRDRVVEIRL